MPCLRAIVVLALLPVLAGVSLAQGVEPTEYEQYMIEIVNRTRADPNSEAASFGIDLNEGLDPGTLTSEPREPVAVDLLLTKVARDHTAHLIANFDDLPPDHRDKSGRDPTDRANDGQVVFIGSVAENNAWTSARRLKERAVDKMHALLFKDFTANFEVEGRGHRKVMLNGSRDMIGLGALQGNFGGKQAAVCTQNFITTDKLHITGVAYVDEQKRDDFYTPGEGLGGVTVAATRRSDGKEFTSDTWASGGYNVEVEPGTYDVEAMGGRLSVPVTVEGVEVTDRNVKVDFAFDKLPPAPIFELVKAIAKLVKKTETWKLVLKKVSYNHGAFGFEQSQLDALVIVVDGVRYFAPEDRAASTVKEKTDKKTGEVVKVVIKDASKNKLLVDLKRSKLKVVLKDAPQFDPTDGSVTVEVDVGTHRSTLTATVEIVGPTQNKGRFAPATGVVERD
ncbi:MAG: hypothetical protein ACYS99_06175 [Planctomycetota bacterium]|jgi:hypothetical protein